jgi:RimJ/RimL family protein N-acetyltransferase
MTAMESNSTQDIPPLWVPVLSLTEGHLQAIVAHLTGLHPDDRYLRFGHVASDEHVQRYAQGIRFDRDDVFGVLNRRLDLIAFAHLAHAADEAPSEAEFGVSVSAHLRGMGMGKRLFQHAILLARNRGVQCLRIHALVENKPMLHIAELAGAQVERCGSDAEARLRLPSPDTVSRLEAWIESNAAQLDYSVKQQAQRLERVRSALTGSK